MQVRSWLTVALMLAGCGSRQAAETDEAAASTAASETDTSTTTTTTTTTSESSESESTTANPETSSSEESGPTPDVPNDLPDECIPVNFLDSEDQGGQPGDVWSGWVYCKDSFFRIEAIDCPYEAGWETCTDPGGCDGCDPSEACLEWYAGSGYCFCGHNCTTDSDCGANEICACRSGVVGDSLTSHNICLPADCSGQADCATIPDESVPRCRLGLDLCGGPAEARCRTEADSCIYEGDCPSQWCSYDPGDELWSCDRPAICE
jgi:hypothetical protein